ncbi:MAG: hypothetical protein EA368_18620 [Leptolyngbya sp. DLM2.Bin27]|nr:MAG: hypothetical protein EA368_18620 [Leptolyngbya sp. DLM2.Bin27]
MRETFTDEEWITLLQAPMQAIMGICLADRVDPVTFLQELRAGVTIVGEELRRSDLVGQLTSALVASMAQIDAADALNGEQLLLKKQFELLGTIQTFKSSKEGREAAIDHMQKVAAILEIRVTGEQANEFKAWLMAVAVKVAESQREGGIMGIGSSRISDRESDVLKKMNTALGLVV